MPEHIQAEVEALDPAAQTVVRLLWHFHEEQMEQFRSLQKQLADRDAQNEALRVQNDKFRQMLFGRRSEKLPPMQSEVRRLVEDEEFPLELPDEATPEEIKAERTKQRRIRGREASEPARKKKRKSVAKLPVIHEHVAVTADQFPDGLSRDDFEPLGDGEVVQRIEHVREHLVVVHYQLEKLVHRESEQIVQATAPLNIVDGGQYGASVHAKVVVSKCVDSMPLYRQTKALERAGHGIARSVLCGMFHRTADVLLPIYERLLALVRVDPYVHADETSLKMLAPGAAKTGWVWTLLCEDIAAYVFSESRSAETAQHLLADTTGHLVVDGYAGYNGVVGEGLRTRAGCWAHNRRKFHEALSTAPEARELLDLIVKLYRVEYKVAQLGHLGTDAHQVLRDEESRPIVDKIEAWVDTRVDAVPPKSPLGQALSYASNQREQLRVFLADPKVPLDNNVAERALRAIAVGRKNFLFVGHQEGGQNLAILQTICSTCLLHGINPYEYIRDVSVRVRTHPNKQIDDLLPMNWKPPPETAQDLWNRADGSG